MGLSIPKPASRRNLVGVETTLCEEAEEGGRVAGWGGDETDEVLADLEGGGPDPDLSGEILDFALFMEKVLSFFIVDRGVSEADRPCLTKRL